jgi:hypothetical protein
MMPRIIVKTRQKRNETGLVHILTSRAMDHEMMRALNEAFLPIDLYKSTQRERLNLYRCVHTSDACPVFHPMQSRNLHL